MTRRELDLLHRLSGNPARSLAEWAEHRDTWPGPYRLDARMALVCASQAGLMDTLRATSRVAPWLQRLGL